MIEKLTIGNFKGFADLALVKRISNEIRSHVFWIDDLDCSLDIKQFLVSRHGRLSSMILYVVPDPPSR